MQHEENVIIGDIVIDPKYQVRMEINPTTSSKYFKCMKLGHKFPPVVIDKKTMKLIGGFTRIEAYKKFKNPLMEIPAKIVSFKNEKEKLR